MKPGRVWCLGSLNADHIYRVERLPAAGETLPARGYARMLGGKGANQSIAAARAGAMVLHIGAVGRDGAWMRDALGAAGVDVRHVAETGDVSGHAVVLVDAEGENAIVIHPGANRALCPSRVGAALDDAPAGSWLLMQNETNGQADAARRARSRGMNLAYSAAPFDVDAVRQVLPYVTLLILNSVEAAQLGQALGPVDVPFMLVTRGADGAVWQERETGECVTVPAYPVPVRDTTGAGDCLAGYMVAGLAEGLGAGNALRRATAAAALQVQREGGSVAIPARAEVDAFLAQE